jgi:hypothetical protein
MSVDSALESNLRIVRSVDGEPHLVTGLPDKVYDALPTGRIQHTRRKKVSILGEARPDAAIVICIGRQKVSHHQILDCRSGFEANQTFFERCHGTS